MIKGALIESIIGEILKQSPTQDSLKQAHPKDIEYQVGRAYSSMLKQYFIDARNLMNVDFDFYSKKYTLPVLNDSSAPYLRYVVLPIIPFELPANLGVRSVRPLGGSFSFERSTEDEIEIYRNLEVFKTGQAYYYKDGGRLSIVYTSNKYKVIDQLVVKIIPHFEDYAMTDNIEFPMGEAEISKTILQTVGFRPTDNTNDDVR